MTCLGRRKVVDQRPLGLKIVAAQALSVSLNVFFLSVATCYSQKESPPETKPFLIFDHTQSPDGRYAVAWGLPKHPDVWTKVCEFERE